MTTSDTNTNGETQTTSPVAQGQLEPEEGDDQAGLDAGVEQKEDGPVHPREVIRTLTAAARSFVTYDARNEIIARLIENFRQAVEGALESHGALVLEVHPFSLGWQGEMIYTEHDREKSLAFRLFRDGVRELTIKPDVPWVELLKLLEILSIRYTGIRQQEDDTLTLLRKADFKSIEFKVVEAYVPAEENPEGSLDQQHLVRKIMPPPDWDLPIPKLTTMAQLQYKPLSEEEVAALQDEYSDEALVTAATQVVDEVLALATRSKSDPGVAEKVLDLIEDICKYMIVELRPKELVWVVRETKAKLGDRPEVEKLAETFGCGDVIDRFLRDPDEVAADAMMPLFSWASGDHLDRVIDRFVREEDPNLRRALKTLLARLAMGKPDVLLEKLGSVPTERVVDLFNVVCVVAPPERAMEAAFSLADHSSPEVQLGALEVLAAAPTSSRLNETMERLLAASTPRVRVKAAAIYGRRSTSRAFARLRDLLEEMAKEELGKVEAEVLGRALMQSGPDTALPLFRTWVKPGAIKGLMLRAKYGEGFRMLRWAAVAGLGEDRSSKNRELLTWLAKRGDDELENHCNKVLSKFEPEREPEPKEKEPKPEGQEQGEGPEGKEDGRGG